VEESPRGLLYSGFLYSILDSILDSFLVSFLSSVLDSFLDSVVEQSLVGLLCSGGDFFLGFVLDFV